MLGDRTGQVLVPTLTPNPNPNLTRTQILALALALTQPGPGVVGLSECLGPGIQGDYLGAQEDRQPAW